MTTFEILATKYKKGLIVLNSTSTTCYYAKIKGHKVIETGVVLKSEIINLVGDEPIIILKEEQNTISIEYNNKNEDMENKGFESIIANVTHIWGLLFVFFYMNLVILSF